MLDFRGLGVPVTCNRYQVGVTRGNWSDLAPENRTRLARVGAPKSEVKTYLVKKGAKVAGKSFLWVEPVGIAIDVTTNLIGAINDYKDVNASWETKAGGIFIQTFIDTGVDIGIVGAFGIVGIALGEAADAAGGGVVGVVICSVVGSVVATELEDNVINPKLKKFYLGQPGG